MNNRKIGTLGVVITSLFFTPIVSAEATSITEALTTGKAYGDFRLRYEDVEQDNAFEDASALTLRSRIGYTTGSFNGFSSTIEMEDSRVIAGVDDFQLPGPARRPDYIVNEFSVIADPETTELDQFFLQYKNDVVTTKVGRQVLTLDDHRFVGHVGWRQDRQTFDAFNIVYAPVDKLSINYSYIGKRNRIFAEEGDIESKDNLLNISYVTPVGKVTAYAYLLEEDDTAAEAVHDTYGIRFAGSTGDSVKFHYHAEFATQTFENSSGADNDTDYAKFEFGLTAVGVTYKVGYELLGSDDGAIGFATPLATLHKFNGWTDQFLGTPAVGLQDFYLSAGGKLFGGKWAVVYHDFTADESTDQLDDLGNELGLLFAKKFGKNYNAGIKYAAYSADDFSVDTDKLWIWVGASF